MRPSILLTSLALLLADCGDAEPTQRPAPRLQHVEDDLLAAVKAFQRPQYAYVPGLADRGLVADLDVVMTVYKGDVESWQRIKGCRTAREEREFSYALRRHRSRFAFPNSWTNGLEKLRSWVKEKAKRNSDAGEFVRAIYEMRIVAEPTDFPAFADIVCIIGPDTDGELRERWANSYLGPLQAMVDDQWCPKVTFRLATTDELSVTEYLSSFRLDFDAMTVAQSSLS